MPPPRFLQDPAFTALTGQQESVLSRRQLGALGVTGHHLAVRVRAGSWQRLGPNVLVLHSGPLSRSQRLWVAVLHGGDRAALSGLTAATADGLTGFESAPLTIVVPHGAFHDDLVDPDVVVRVAESRHLGPTEVHPARNPRRTRIPRSIIDAASTAATAARCRAIIAAAVQQRLVQPGELERIAISRTAARRRALILETVVDAAGGSHSLPELQYLDGLRRTGLPLPTRQRVVRRKDGRYYLDADFEEFEVTVEINGAQHLDLRAREYDDIRRARLSIGGRLIVDIGTYTVRHDIDLAVLITAEALLSRGWRPSPSVRRRLQRMAAGRGATTLPLVVGG